MQITSKIRPTRIPRDSLKLLVLRKENTRTPTFFQITSKTRPPGGSRDPFKLLHKQNTSVPEILSSYFKNKTYRGCPTFFESTLKTKHEIPKILSNYFKTETHKEVREIHQSTSKIKYKGSPKKKKTERSPRFFQIHRSRDFEIISNFSKTQEMAKLLSNYFKNKTRDLRGTFYLLQK